LTIDEEKIILYLSQKIVFWLKQQTAKKSPQKTGGVIMSEEKTSQSIFVTLDSLEVETSVPAIKDKKGNILRKNYGMVGHTLPRELFPTSEQFEEESKLLAWANANDCLHACLQLGVSQFLIKCRAAFKACKKDDIWSNAYGQENVNAMEWKVQERPKAKGMDV